MDNYRYYQDMNRNMNQNGKFPNLPLGQDPANHSRLPSTVNEQYQNQEFRNDQHVNGYQNQEYRTNQQSNENLNQDYRTEQQANTNQVPQKTDFKENEKQDSTLQSIKQLGQTAPPAEVKNDIHTIPIVGQIEGHLVLPAKNKTTKYEHIIPQLVAVEENPNIKGLLVILNTVGGDIEAGLAISEMISSMSTPTVSIVLGGGHSIGVPIAVATDYSYIVSTASMTVHPIRLTGMVIGVPQTYEYLDKMQDRITRFVSMHSRISEEKFRELMFRTGELVRDIGTVLIGKEAVDVGIVDEVGGLNEALVKLRYLIDRREGVVN